MAGLALLACPLSAGTQDFDTVQVSIAKVRDGVYMITGRGGNIGVSVGDDGVALVDSQFGQLHARIVRAIASVNTGTVRFILNTNWHYDHALGNEAFRRDGAVVVAHENCLTRMAHDQVHDVIGAKTPAYPAAAWPVVTFSDTLKLRVNGEEIEAIHIPGAHSDADVLYRFRKANVVHAGDLVFSAGYPYIDIGNGGSIDGMIAAAERILDLTDEHTAIIPGHGPLADRRRVEQYRAMLVEVRARVARLVKDGKTLDEAVAARPTADFDPAWKDAMPPASFVALVFKSLAGRSPTP
jgi:glyoxylase-like metal-dependent hydrolase (beta-lactamase superfamily II)